MTRKLTCGLLFACATLRASPLISPSWKAVYDGSFGRDAAAGIIVSGGSVHVAGSSQGAPGDLLLDYVTLRYDTAGTILHFVSRYDGPPGLMDYCRGIAVDSQGNTYVTGESGIEQGAGSDFATIKYDPQGNLIWLARYDGPAGDQDHAIAIALDEGPPLAIYVTGWSYGSNFDYATVKYDAGGNEVWSARYDGPAGQWDTPAAISLVPGRVVVTGSSAGVGTSRDYATIFYDAATGSPLAVRRYNGIANGWDSANAIAADPEGRVYVTGGSEGVGTGSDYATLLYDAGAELVWVKRYEGPGFAHDDVAKAIAVDGWSVYVAGWVADPSTGYDYGTVKYDRDDLSAGYGTEVWVQVVDGGHGGEDNVHGIAVDGAGHVIVTGRATLESGSAAMTLQFHPNGFPVGLARCYRGGAGLDNSGRVAVAVDASRDIYVAASVRETGSSQLGDLVTLKYESSAYTYILSSGAFYKAISTPIGFQFEDPVAFQGSLEIERAEVEAFRGSAVFALAAMEIRTSSGETYRLRNVPPREDPVLAATQGEAPGSLMVASARSAQAWVVLEGPGVDRGAGYQGLCFLPASDRPDGAIEGDMESPSGFDFTQDPGDGTPPGIALHEYRVVCPDGGGRDDCIVESRLFAVLAFEATRLGPPDRGEHACIAVGDVHEEPAGGLDRVELGPATLNAAVSRDGATHSLDVRDCDGDGSLDLWIPWSREEAQSPALIDLREVCPSALPGSVSITSSYLGDDVLWEARTAGATVASEVALLGPGPRTVTLSSAAGIEEVVVREGADICLHEVCWKCPVVSTPPPACTAELAGSASGDVITLSATLGGDLDPRAGENLVLAAADEVLGISTVLDPASVEVRAEAVEIVLSERCEDLFPSGRGIFELRATCARGTWSSAFATFECPRGGKNLKRGDCNSDGEQNISDALFHLTVLFSAGEMPDCLDACDVNVDGEGNISDPIFLLTFLFSTGLPPGPPFPDCGAPPGGAAVLGCEGGSC